MSEYTKQTVIEWLNSVDYGDDDFYVPDDFALEFVNFIKMVNGNAGEEHETPVTHFRMLDNVHGPDQKIVNMCSRGLAKSLPLTNYVYTDKGTVTIGNVKVGEKIFGEDGKLTTITHKSEIFNGPMYKIFLADGRELVVSEDHINTVIHKRVVRYGGRPGYCKTEYQKRNLTTKELLSYSIIATRPKTQKNPSGYEVNFWIPNCQAIQYTEKRLPLDPYTLGLILGDGSSDRNTGYVRLHGHKDDMPFYRKQIPYDMGNIYTDKRNTNVITQGIKGIGALCKQLSINVHGNYKQIPPYYICSSIEQRLALLQGLMDTDGTCYKNGGTAFTSNSIRLAENVRDLVRSLGGIATISPMAAAFRVNIKCNFSIFRLPRKADRQHIKSVEKVGILDIQLVATVPSQCIKVANETETFITNDYTVTHNTTLMGEYLFLYIAVYGEIPGFGKVSLALYVSDSIENGVKNMRKNLEFRRENSEFLMTYIPEVRFTDIRWEFKNADGNVFIVKGYGSKTGVRGSKEMGVRPQLAVLDDLISDEDARSDTVIASVEATVNKAVNFALHPTKSKIIWSGTPFNARDPLYKAVESGAWKVNVFPVCNQFPCSNEDFRGAWESRFPYSYVKKQYDFAMAQGKIADFNQELMLRIMSEEDRLIEDGDILWYDRSTLLSNKAKFNFYITTDFATSEKQSADYSVISVWALNNKGFIFLVDGVCKRQTMDKNIDDLFRLAQLYSPQQVGIEVSGQQGGFIPWIQGQMLDRNSYFNLASEGHSVAAGIRPNTNKMVRFNIVVPWFKSHLMFFPKETKDSALVQECLTELSLVSAAGMKSKHDDVLDTISMLASLKMWRPSEETKLSKTVKGMWDIEDEDKFDTGGLSSYVV